MSQAAENLEQSDSRIASSSRRPNVSSTQWLVFALLIVVGIACRFWIDTPNFKPVAAFALFGGFFFRKPAMAIGVVLILMMLADFRLGFYSWPTMVCVYASLAMAVALGMLIKRRSGSGWKLGAGFLTASLTMSTVFYLLTNLAVWCVGGWYPATWAGLAECYTAAIPFYRMTMAGDLFFTTLTVGVFATASLVVAASRGGRVDLPLEATAA